MEPALELAAGEQPPEGYDSVWLSEGSCDPLVWAAGILASSDIPLVGVVAPLVGVRHPAMLARELGALDLFAGGRTALLLSDGAAPVPQLIEAVSIIRRLFGGETIDVDGSFYQVSGGRLKPPPASRPPIAVEIDPFSADWHLLGLIEMVDAVVVTGGPGPVLEARHLVDQVASGTEVWGRGGDWRQATILREAGADAVICRSG